MAGIRLHGTRVLGVALVLCLAAEASAQIPIGIKVGGREFGPAAANKKLDALDRKVQNGFNALPKSYGKDPAAEGKGLQQAAGIAAAAKEELSGDLKLGGAKYNKVEERIKNLELAVAQGRLQHACSSARQVILNKNGAWIPAAPEDLAAFDTCVAEMKKGHKDAKSIAFWEAEAKKVRDDQPRIKEQGAQKAARAAAKAKAKELTGVTKEADDIVDRIKEHMKKAINPVPDAELQALDAAMAKVAAIHEPAAHYYASQKRRFLIYNAWFNGGAAAVAQVMKGSLAAGGSTDGKTMKIAFTAEPGQCYSLVTRWKIWSGAEKMEDFAWNGKGGNSDLQRYSISSNRNPWMHTNGLCATKKVKVTATAKLTFAGTRNGIEYALVSWAKPQFPVEEAAYAAVWKGDACNVDYWKKLWLDPVPGSIVYLNNEPFIVRSPDRARQSWLTLLNVSGRDTVRAKKDDVQSDPPQRVLFKTQVSAPKCPSYDYAESKLSKKLAKCSEKVREKYAKLYSSASRAKENARTASAWRAAKRRLAGLGDKESREWDAKCKPIRKKIVSAFEKTYNEIVDSYMQTPPPMHVDRARRMVDEN